MAICTHSKRHEADRESVNSFLSRYEHLGTIANQNISEMKWTPQLEGFRSHLKEEETLIPSLQGKVTDKD